VLEGKVGRCISQDPYQDFINAVQRAVPPGNVIFTPQAAEAPVGPPSMCEELIDVAIEVGTSHCP
jgi:hypothetical protein